VLASSAIIKSPAANFRVDDAAEGETPSER
jgi:hypothetical protein